MIQANFDSNFNYCIVPGLWQWDYGQILQISGTNIEEDIEVHFSLFERGGESIVLIGVYDDEKNVLSTHIPGHLLSHQTNRDYNIYAFIYFNSGSEGETVYKIVFPIKARPKPIDYDDKEDEAFNVTLAEAVQQVNDAKESAQTSVSEARQSANEALEFANRSLELATEIESQVAVAVSSAESASNSAAQADESASNANQSANDASSSADSASQSASSAQTSANNASTSEQNAHQSAEDAHQSVEDAQDILKSVQAKGDEIIESLTDDFTQVQNDILKAFPTDSATGAIASFNDGADDIPVKSLVVNITPVRSGSGDPSPDNVRPISGWTGADLTCNNETINIDWTDEVGEVFGGTLDVTTGVLTVDRAMVDLGTLTWTYFTRTTPPHFGATVTNLKQLTNNILCSAYEVIKNKPNVNNDKTIRSTSEHNVHGIKVSDTSYTDAAAFKTAMSGVQLVYELETPTTVQLTPQEVKTILGENTIFADTGDVSVEYRADIKKYIDKVVAMAISALS